MHALYELRTTHTHARAPDRSACTRLDQRAELFESRHRLALPRRAPEDGAVTHGNARKGTLASALGQAQPQHHHRCQTAAQPPETSTRRT